MYRTFKTSIEQIQSNTNHNWLWLHAQPVLIIGRLTDPQTCRMSWRLTKRHYSFQWKVSLCLCSEGCMFMYEACLAALELDNFLRKLS